MSYEAMIMSRIPSNPTHRTIRVTSMIYVEMKFRAVFELKDFRSSGLSSPRVEPSWRSVSDDLL